MALSATPKIACVWGANGISGMAMIDTLVEQPRDEWSKIICISRRPPQLDVDDDRIQFISIDILQADEDEIVSELIKAGGEEITHVYHYTYIEKKDEKELNEVNRILFENALEATARVAKHHVKCFQLQTGYKYYGVHKGGEYLAPSPFFEETPRHKGRNFYYTQEDLLREYAIKNSWKYVITRPNVIIGASKGNFMNFAVSIALYAVVQKEKGEPLIYPGNELSWNSTMDHSGSLNNARFQLWSSINDKAANQAFNIHNGDEVKVREIWPKIEKYFDLPHHEQTFDKTKKPTKGEINVLQHPLAKYMPQNKEVWHRIAEREKLDEKAFDYATWEFADFVVSQTVDNQGDMSKARKLGWTTTVDTSQCYIECFEQLKKLKIIPSN